MPKKDLSILTALSKYENKIDRISDRLDSIEKIQVKQEANIGEHMRRTDLAEENTSLLRKQVEVSIKDLQDEFKPIQKHVLYTEGFLKGLGILALIATITEGVLALIRH